MADDAASSSSAAPPARFRGLSCLVKLLSGVGGPEESEPLQLPSSSRKSFLLNEEELRLSWTASHATSSWR